MMSWWERALMRFALWLSRRKLWQLALIMFPTFVPMIVGFEGGYSKTATQWWVMGSFIPFMFLVMFLFVGLIQEVKGDWLIRTSDSLEAIRKLRWRDFEAFVGAVLTYEKYRVDLHGGAQADGGRDLVATRTTQFGDETILEKVIVQCKHYRYEKVGVDVVRELRGVVARDEATGGMLVTSGDFSDEARTEAQKMKIELVDGEALYKRCQAAREAMESDPVTPSEKERELKEFVDRTIAEIRKIPDVLPRPRCEDCGRLKEIRHKQGTEATNNYWSCPKSTHDKRCGKYSPVKFDKDA